MGEGFPPVPVGLCCVSGVVFEVGQAVVCAGLFVPVGGLFGEQERGVVVGVREGRRRGTTASTANEGGRTGESMTTRRTGGPLRPSEASQRVSYLELFFDLALVFGLLPTFAPATPAVALSHRSDRRTQIFL
jgi:hypothetical protein